MDLPINEIERLIDNQQVKELFTIIKNTENDQLRTLIVITALVIERKGPIYEFKNHLLRYIIAQEPIIISSLISVVDKVLISEPDWEDDWLFPQDDSAVFVIQPGKATIKAFLTILETGYRVFSEVDIELPRSIALKSIYQDALSELSKEKIIDTNTNKWLSQKIEQWHESSKITLYEQVRTSDISPKRWETFVNDVLSTQEEGFGFSKIVQWEKRSRGSFVKIDKIVNVPKIPLVQDIGPPYVYYSVTGLGTSLGGSVGEGMTKYIVDKIVETLHPQKLSFQDLYHRVERKEGYFVIHPSLIKSLVEGGGGIPFFEDYVLFCRYLDDTQVIFTPDCLGKLIVKEDF